MGKGGSFPGWYSGRGVKLTTHLQLVPSSIKYGSIHPLPHTPSWRRSTGTTLSWLSGIISLLIQIFTIFLLQSTVYVSCCIVQCSLGFLMLQMCAHPFFETSLFQISKNKKSLGVERVKLNRPASNYITFWFTFSHLVVVPLEDSFSIRQARWRKTSYKPSMLQFSGRK
jgi:hypothetical protein